jgi:hypothetical protein
MIEAIKAGKYYRLWDRRTLAEKFKVSNSVLIKADDSIQAERLARKIINTMEGS